MPKKNTHKQELEQQVAELTADLQRQRADFENYHKRAELDKAAFAEMAKGATIMKLLPVIDNIERALSHAPAELAEDKWVQGVTSLPKHLEKSLADLGVTRIDAQPGAAFDPHLHEAVTMDEAEGEHEVVAEELRAGYKMGEQVIRPSMVRVTRQA